jgi:hypothetical protein
MDSAATPPLISPLQGFLRLADDDLGRCPQAGSMTPLCGSGGKTRTAACFCLTSRRSGSSIGAMPRADRIVVPDRPHRIIGDGRGFSRVIRRG